MLNLIHSLVGHLFANPFASGGLLLMGLGGIAASLRKIPGALWVGVERKFTTTVTIKQSDPLFNWVSVWLAEQPYAKTKCKSLLGTTILRQKFSSGPIPMSKAANVEPGVPNIDLVPSQGTHYFKWGKLWVALSRHKEAQSGTEHYTPEELVLTFSTVDRKLVIDMLNEARVLSNPPGKPKTHVYTNSYENWILGNELSYRSAGSLVLPTGQFELLEADMRKYYSSRDYYEHIGMPYRRGYCFHGVPGSGKTTTIRTLASMFGCSIYVLNLSDSLLSDSKVSTLVSKVETDRALIVIEDIDSYFDGRTPKNPKMALSFSGLLNAIDGVTAREDTVLIMTTNYREGLDSALMRPGRVDFELEFTYITDEQLERMFFRFNPEGTAEQLQAFKVELGSIEGVTAAEVQHALYIRSTTLN